MSVIWESSESEHHLQCKYFPSFASIESPTPRNYPLVIGVGDLGEARRQELFRKLAPAGYLILCMETDIITDADITAIRGQLCQASIHRRRVEEAVTFFKPLKRSWLSAWWTESDGLGGMSVVVGRKQEEQPEALHTEP